MIGRSFGLPYWRCSPVFGYYDEVLIRDVVNNISSLDEAELSVFRATVLRHHGFASHEYESALRHAQNALCGGGPCNPNEFERLAWLHLYRPALEGDIAASGKPAPKARSLNFGAPGTPKEAVNANVCGESINRGWKPVRISGIDPEYPSRARSQGIEGRVRARITIDPMGKVVNVRIMESDAMGVFDNTVIRTVRNWRFQPDQFALGDREVTIPFVFNLGS
jgi:TonB family protein